MTANSRIPSATTPAVGPGGFFSQPWFRFFASLIAPAAAIETQTVSASPYTFTASASGRVLISGGTVTNVHLIRGGVSIVVPAGFVPVSQGDAVAVVYTVAPSVWFIPE
jgi:hypothetical protein